MEGDGTEEESAKDEDDFDKGDKEHRLFVVRLDPGLNELVELLREGSGDRSDSRSSGSRGGGGGGFREEGSANKGDWKSVVRIVRGVSLRD